MNESNAVKLYFPFFILQDIDCKDLFSLRFLMFFECFSHYKMFFYLIATHNAV